MRANVGGGSGSTIGVMVSFMYLNVLFQTFRLPAKWFRVVETARQDPGLMVACT